MGNQPAKKNGGILINFDKPFYYPGDLVTGSIYLTVTESFETKGLELTLKIKEYVKWLEKGSVVEKKQVYDEQTKTWKTNPENKNAMIERKDKNTLFKSTCVIGTMMNNIFGLGQYNYPFQFVLPQHLPGSFEYYDDAVSASIKYMVSARTIPWNNSKDLEMSANSIIVVRQSAQNFEYPNNLSDTKNLSTWCFVKQGTSTLNVSYPKNNFLQDESVQVICQLNNTRCKLNCKCIKLQLFQRITLKCFDQKSVGDTRYLTRCLAQSRFNGTYLAGQETFKTIELAMTDLKNPTNKHLDKCKHRHLFRDQSMVSKLQATVKSRNIDCSYFLRVSTEFASCTCCSSSPTIDIPVIIYIPDIMHDVNLFRPQNWNPQVMSMYQMNIPSIAQPNMNQGGMGNNAYMNMNVNNNNMNANNNNMNNMNVNVNNTAPYTQMIQTSYEPIQVQTNSNMMMTGGTEPKQNY